MSTLKVDLVYIFFKIIKYVQTIHTLA